ncbi:hypothetical protein SAMN05428989_3061 [Pseudoxanthomonas sp. GM95]|uniref:hypothetical protein n=1 Tax=Pseudoxanthomonas sp. GM95 TaxID=1881043 RepID=UPI0008C0C3B5|nr:hypothetical protein [Pseudoxanthomonas sp. GM95]SEM10442.1 hypothetical protein SAMN05428989_3061 [Pseudoxanthomonas sp. GM95]
MRVFSHPRFLQVYSAVLTAVLVIGVTTGATRGPDKTRFEEITVQKLTLVEPDGTTRLVLANNAKLPGAVFGGREYAHEGRKADGTAGMIFYDAEGTESGGLVFSGLKRPDGTISRDGHLSFDAYGQDELSTWVSAQEGGKVKNGIQFKDQPDWPLEDALKAMQARPGTSEAEQQAALETFMANRAPMHVQRAWLGRNPDASSSLDLRDRDGKLRISARVAADGTPTLQFLDAEGKVTATFPPAAAR